MLCWRLCLVDASVFLELWLRLDFRGCFLAGCCVGICALFGAPVFLEFCLCPRFEGYLLADLCVGICASGFLEFVFELCPVFMPTHFQFD